MNAELIESSGPLHAFRGVLALLAVALVGVGAAWWKLRTSAADPAPSPPTQPASSTLPRTFRLLGLVALLQVALLVILVWALLLPYLSWAGAAAIAFFAAPFAVAYLNLRRRGRLPGGFGW